MVSMVPFNLPLVCLAVQINLSHAVVTTQNFSGLKQQRFIFTSFYTSVIHHGSAEAGSAHPWCWGTSLAEQLPSGREHSRGPPTCSYMLSLEVGSFTSLTTYWTQLIPCSCPRVASASPILWGNPWALLHITQGLHPRLSPLSGQATVPWEPALSLAKITPVLLGSVT